MRMITAVAETETVIARARRILAGKSGPAPEPDMPVDMQFGIDRTLRTVRRPRPVTPDTAQAAARAGTAIEGTLIAIDTLLEHLSEALELTDQARGTTDMAARAMMAARYEELRAGIDTVTTEARFEGLNLIDAGHDAIEINPQAWGKATHAINHITLVSGERGLSLLPAADTFQSDQNIDAVRTSLLIARQRLDRAADTFLNQACMLAPLQDSADTK